MLRILIADDHPLVRQGLKQTIREDFGDTMVGEACTGSEVLDAVQKERWDAIILDLNLPDRSGLDVLKTIKVVRPDLPVVVLSMYPEQQYAVRVLKAGAAGYVTKESAPEELGKALRKALQGGRYVSPTLAEDLADDLSLDSSRPAHAALSDRELEVLRLLALGKTVSDIADQIALSVKTVSTYRARILEKLHLKTTADIIRYAVDNHLAE